MPIIPYVEESQKLNASNPVPIAGTGDARLQGEAVAGLGRGMFALGDVLDKLGKRQKDERDRLKVAEVFGQMRLKALNREAERVAAAPIENDVTGVKQVQEYQKIFDEDKKEMMDLLENDRQKMMFTAQAGDLLADTSIKLLGVEVEKRAENNKALKNKVLGDFAGIARNIPEELEDTIALAEITVMENPNYTEAQKAKEVFEVRRRMVNEAIEGQKARGAYTDAKITLEKYGQNFSPEEKSKMLESIDDSDWKAASRETQQVNLREKKNEEFVKQREKILQNDYFSQLKQAGNNMVKREIIQKSMDEKVAAGLMTRQLADSLMGNKTFQKEADEVYESIILTEAFGKRNYDDLTKKMWVDLKEQRVSPEKYNDIIGRLKNMRERDNEPGRRDKERNGIELLESIEKESINDPLSSFQKRQLAAQVARAKDIYYKALAKNPDADPYSLAASIYEGTYKTVIPRVKGTNFMGLDTPKGIDEAKSKLVSEELARGGNSTKETRKETQKKLRELEDQKKSLIKVKPFTAAPVTTPTTKKDGGGARGN